ncbi:MAG: hypothetical protein FD148_2529 [Methylocystaceae bacterium]|nr:MAG: hypothetical protein FD148_2529 [Methylocystaceae bacterium]
MNRPGYAGMPEAPTLERTYGRPVCKQLYRERRYSVCFNVSGLDAKLIRPRWRYARPGPHNGGGVRRHPLNQVSRTPFDCLAIFDFNHPQTSSADRHPRRRTAKLRHAATFTSCVANVWP